MSSIVRWRTFTKVNMIGKKGPILITGGSGYIGTALIEKLSLHYFIINLDIIPPKINYPDVEFKKIDISDVTEIETGLSEIRNKHGENILSVIHLAGYYNFNGEESPLYQKVNIEGTNNLLQVLNKYFDVRQFIFSSSMLVYSPSEEGEKITEDSPVDPGWAYPQSKIECEKIINDSRSRIPVVILRIAAVYNDYAHSPSIAQQILRINEMHFTSLVFPGNPHHRQSAIHLDDLVEVFQLLIMRQNEIPEKITLSVAEDETPNYEELQRSISLLIHKKELPIISVPKLFAKSGAFVISAMPSSRKSFIKPWMIKYSDANYDIDNTKLKTLLDWHPLKNLKGTLHLIIANLIKYPGTWYRINKIPRPPFGSVMRTKIVKDVLI